MPEDYTARTGDCILSIAYEHGFFWETLWNDAGNAELKQKRKSPNILVEGDVVHIPDLTPKEESGATEKRHQFKLKAVPAVLILKIRHPCPEEEEEPESESDEPAEEPEETVIDDPEETEVAEEPAANVPYILDIDGVLSEGQTDDGGEIRISIPPNAQSGRLRVEPGTPREQEIELHLGGLDPVDTPRGMAQRLSNLGFGVFGGEAEVTEADLTEPLQNFQRNQALEATGRADRTTQDKLKEAHGS
jgi:hypothetical protein